MMFRDVLADLDEGMAKLFKNQKQKIKWLKINWGCEHLAR